mgnify:CR=1 FL=1
MKESNFNEYKMIVYDINISLFFLFLMWNGPITNCYYYR